MIALQKKQASSSNRAKPPAPLGLPDDLFPVDILTEKEQALLSQRINSKESNERVILEDCRNAHIAILHHEQVWLAAWQYKDSSADYIYGIKVAHKAAASTRSKVPLISLCREMPLTRCDDMEEIKYGKTIFLTKQALVTKEMILSNSTYNGTFMPWRTFINRYTKRGGQKARAMALFTNKIAESIDRWEDDSDIFSRMRMQDNSYDLIYNGRYGSDVKNLGRATPEKLVRKVNDERITKVMSTPYFSKNLNKIIAEFEAKFNSPNCTKRNQVLSGVTLWLHKVDVLKKFLDIWPDASLDYCQQVFELAAYHDEIHFGYGSGPVITWLNKNMQPASYIKIIQKAVTDMQEVWSNNPNVLERASTGSHWGGPTFRLNELADTVNMLNNIWNQQQKEGKQSLELAPPSRWRINEFHDYVSSVSFKYSTPNETLPRDLFPQPIRVEEPGQKYSFFQPCDVHQLGAWGKAVRNCVGSADSYRKGIKNKTHFIILVMLNNEPRYTIQATVRNGGLIVDQIADVCNKRLEEDQRSFCELAFGKALQVRTAQIKQTEQ
jgi:hypothetical protein